MKKYKLIKEYPGSPKLGIIVESPNYYTDDTKTTGRWIPEDYILQFPQYWEEVKEKEYEILEITTNIHKRLSCVKDYSKEYIDALLACEHNYINSVKRLSDNEVFQIGDKCTNPAGQLLIIDSFYLDCNKNHMLVGSSIGAGHVGISKIKKYVEPLFITEDGVATYEGDKTYYVYKNYDNYSYQYGAWSGDSTSKNDKYFSTETKAQEYIDKKNEERLLDAKVLSYNDIAKWANMSTEASKQLKELVKSKQ